MSKNRIEKTMNLSIKLHGIKFMPKYYLFIKKLYSQTFLYDDNFDSPL